jgi:hypothetical protein
MTGTLAQSYFGHFDVIGCRKRDYLEPGQGDKSNTPTTLITNSPPFASQLLAGRARTLHISTDKFLAPVWATVNCEGSVPAGLAALLCKVVRASIKEQKTGAE